MQPHADATGITGFFRHIPLFRAFLPGLMGQDTVSPGPLSSECGLRRQWTAGQL